MHEQAYAFVRDNARTDAIKVLDLGGRDVNGTVRDLFPDAADYVVVDINPGDGVDIVADAADLATTEYYDVVVCCETFEHAQRWREICDAAFRSLHRGGQFVATMAGPGRPEHSAIDGEFRLLNGEYYGNVDPGELFDVLERCGFVNITVDSRPSPADTRATAYRPPVGKDI
jgi:SAM-dependent methyltransferase